MNNKQGFTLIELLTVVLIFSILTSIALPQYQKSIRRAEAANALITLKTLFDSSKRYYSSSSIWPQKLSQIDVEILDADRNAPDPIVGEFQYTFYSTKRIETCRLINTAPEAYCLNAYYEKNGHRDVYTCSSNTPKFNSLCASLCGTVYNGECEIK